jgi:large subunit ribosomal protein L30
MTRLQITWVKSSIGYSLRQKRTIRALGLRRLGDVVEQPDSPAVRGMLDKVSHLVRVEAKE